MILTKLRKFWRRLSWLWKGQQIRDSLDLSILRDRIDRIDAKSIDLFIARSDIVISVGTYKRANDKPVRDRAREAVQMRKIHDACIKKGRPELWLPMALIFRGVIESSVILQGEHQSPTGSLYCVLCDWRSNGLRDPLFDWPVCPACGTPLFFPPNGLARSGASSFF